MADDRNALNWLTLFGISYYTTRAREFIDVLQANKDLPIDEIECITRVYGAGYTAIHAAFQMRLAQTCWLYAEGCLFR